MLQYFSVDFFLSSVSPPPSHELKYPGTSLSFETAVSVSKNCAVVCILTNLDAIDGAQNWNVFLYGEVHTA